MIEVKFLGQCGVFLCSEQIKIAIDPVLNDMLDENGCTIRNYPAVMTYEELDVDYILCTHDHIDHMPEETLKKVCKAHPNTKIIVPCGCVPQVEEWSEASDEKSGIRKENIIGISDGEAVRLPEGGVTVKGLSVAHPVHQVDENGKDHNLAYSMELDGKRIVHLGDTYLTERLENGLKELGPVDLFFPPVNGRDDERESRGIIGNLSCEEAAELAVRLQVKFTIPTHFDMVIGNTEDPQKFAKRMDELGGKYQIPVLMQSVTL